MHVTKISASTFNRILRLAAQEDEAVRAGFESHPAMVLVHRESRRRMAREYKARAEAEGAK